MKDWKYTELLCGNTYVGCVMDGERVVCKREHVGIDVCNPGEEVARTQEELKEIVGQQAEIEQLRVRLKAADDHPLVLEEGGTDGVDRCHRVINRLSSPNWYWDDNCPETAFESVEDTLIDYGEGEIVTIRPLHELPKMFVVVGHTACEYNVCPSREAAEAAGGEL